MAYGREDWKDFCGHFSGCEHESLCPVLPALPTATFSLLYCFFIISHDRSRSVHFNVTPHPTSTWIVLRK